jgi:hypothetical protein
MTTQATELRAEVNGVALWVGEREGQTTAVVNVYSTGTQGWAATSTDAVALVAQVIAGEAPPAVLADYLDDNPQELHNLPTCGARAASMLRADTVAPKVHIRTWTGSGVATVFDMTNAGKRGKMCRVIRFSGWGNSAMSDTPEGKASDFSRGVCHWLNALPLSVPFDVIRAEMGAKFEEFRRTAGNPFGIEIHDEEARGVDAPKPPLTAGVPGKWSAPADEDGVSIHALDDVNEWTEITSSSQHKNVAYQKAAKVWDRVRKAKDRHEAHAILTAAGCKLHGFCGRD